MREDIKIKILQNLLDEITKKYDYFISLQEKEYKKTYDMAVRDNLTGLYNRYYLKDYLLHVIEKAKRENRKIYVVFLDLDNFKHINDFYGHSKGDEVLKEVSKVIKQHFRSYDIVSRYGGDEFVVLFEFEYSPEQQLENLKKYIEEKFKNYELSVSYGTALFPNDIKETHLPKEEIIEELITIADKRMYEQKKLKKFKKS